MNELLIKQSQLNLEALIMIGLLIDILKPYWPTVLHMHIVA